ncbi:MAG: putative lipid II flippase FtsW [Pseudomonadota bacterium]
MMTRALNHIRNFNHAGTRLSGVSNDAWLSGIVLALLTIGVIMVASASITTADKQTTQPFYYLWRQAMFILAGLGGAAIVRRIPLAWWENASRMLLVAAVVMLVVVFIPGLGRTLNGSTRWLALGPISIQVSEAVKLCTIVFLAGYLARHDEALRTSLAALWRPLAILSVLALLLLIEPDLGATVIIFGSALIMLFIAGTPLKYFLSLAAAVIAIFSALVVTSPYRLKRMISFSDPWADPFNTGFQLTQALIAFGRGEWWGVGLGGSVQKLFYLPEAHTDFIYAVLAEELGLIGALSVIVLFGLLCWRALVIGRRAREVQQDFAAYLAWGIGAWLGLQAFINIAVNMGLLPTKGLTLPFISYGGSSVFICLIAVALLLRVDRETQDGSAQQAQQRRGGPLWRRAS